MKVNFYKKIENGERKYSSPFYFSSKTYTIVNDLDFDNRLNISYQTVLSRIQK